jgi:tape measure domain-containing protein
MALLKHLKVVIGLSKKGLTKLNADLRRTKSNFRRNFGEIAGIAKRAGAVIVAGVGAGLTAIIKSGAKLQTLKVGFRSIMGSAEGAAKMVDKLNEFTASTPFQLEEVSRSARQLIAVGTGVDDVTDRLRMLGDIAAASGNSISDIAAIFAKVQAKGKVELENLNQLAERGIPIFDQLRKVTGDANMEFGAGAVTVEEFNDALAQMADKGGFANDAMANLSETVDGRLTTAFDNVTLALGQFAEKSGLLSAVTTVLEDFTHQLQRASLSESDLQKSREQFYDLRQKFKQAHKGNIEDLMNEAKAARQLAFDLNQVLDTMNTAAHLKGVDVFIDKLEEAFAFRGTHLSALPDAPSAGKTLIEPTRPQNMAAAMSVSAGLIERSLSEKVLKPLRGVADILDEIATEKVQRMEQAQMQMAMTLSTTFQNVFSTLLSGTQTFGEIMTRILQDLTVRLVSMVAAFAVISALTGGTVGAAGLGAFLKAGLNIPQMAQGGLFTGASLAMVGEGPGTSAINPEVVAPLDKLQQMMGGGNVTVTGRLDGRDILISSERAGFDRNRVRGF